MTQETTGKEFENGIHRSIAPRSVPPWFSAMRSRGARLGIRVEAVLSVSGRMRHLRIQFRVQSDRRRKWWRVGYWHPHNGRLFLDGRPGYLEISDCSRALEAAARSCGLSDGSPVEDMEYYT